MFQVFLNILYIFVYNSISYISRYNFQKYGIFFLNWHIEIINSIELAAGIYVCRTDFTSKDIIKLPRQLIKLKMLIIASTYWFMFLKHQMKQIKIQNLVLDESRMFWPADVLAWKFWPAFF